MSSPLGSCGSGEVSEKLASILSESACISTDVNTLAAKKTRALLDKSSSHSDVVLCDLFTAFKPDTEFDVIVFNPPYVPTDDDELHRALHTRDISASWAGGKDGREVTDNFLTQFGDFLTPGGVMYLVLLDANKPQEVLEDITRLGYSVKTIKRRKAGIEDLYILRFQKN